MGHVKKISNHQNYWELKKWKKSTGSLFNYAIEDLFPGLCGVSLNFNKGIVIRKNQNKTAQV